MAKPPATRQESARIDPQREADLMEKWMDNQRKEMDIQIEQMKLKNREIDNDKALAEKSIEAQLQDRTHTREHTRKMGTNALIFFGIVIAMLLVFGGYVISQGKEAVLTEIISLFTELFKYGIGAVTGYFLAKAKFKTDDSNKTDSD